MVFPLLTLQHAEGLEDLVGEGLAVGGRFEGGLACGGGGSGEGLAGLDASVEFLETGYELGVLTFEHLDITVSLIYCGQRGGVRMDGRRRGMDKPFAEDGLVGFLMFTVGADCIVGSATGAGGGAVTLKMNWA